MLQGQSRGDGLQLSDILSQPVVEVWRFTTGCESTLFATGPHPRRSRSERERHVARSIEARRLEQAQRPGIQARRQRRQMQDDATHGDDNVASVTISRRAHIGHNRRVGDRECSYRPDVTVLDANPLDDITNTLRINAVYMRGTAVGRAGLRAAWVGRTQQ